MMLPYPTPLPAAAAMRLPWAGPFEPAASRVHCELGCPLFAQLSPWTPNCSCWLQALHPLALQNCRFREQPEEEDDLVHTPCRCRGADGPVGAGEQSEGEDELALTLKADIRLGWVARTLPGTPSMYFTMHKSQQRGTHGTVLLPLLLLLLTPLLTSLMPAMQGGLGARDQHSSWGTGEGAHR